MRTSICCYGRAIKIIWKERYLTGTMTHDRVFDPETDLRARFPRFTQEALRANWPVVELLHRVPSPILSNNDDTAASPTRTVRHILGEDCRFIFTAPVLPYPRH